MTEQSFREMTQQDVHTAQRLGRGDLSRYLIALAAVRRGLVVRFETFVSEETKSFYGSSPNYSGRYLSVSDGKRTVYFDGTRGQDSVTRSNNLAVKKDDSKRMFEARGVRTPKSIVCEADQSAMALNFLKQSQSDRYILKPTAGSLGNGVVLNIPPEDVPDMLGKRKGKWIIEEMIHGPEYRVFVSNKKAIATFQRHAPRVVGNGIDTVRNLINNKNDAISRSALPYNKIDLDQSDGYLRSIGRDLGYKPRFLETVCLDDKKFTSGLETVNATDTVPDSVKEEAVNAAKVVGLPNAGVDVLYCESRNLPYVLEVNPRANIQHHTFPTIGDGQGLAVPHSILDFYFPRQGKVRAFRNFPVDFIGIQKSLESGLFRRVEIVSPKRNWISRTILLRGPQEEAAKTFEMLKMVCIFANWYHRSEGDNRIDVYFLERGYRGFVETFRSNSVPVVSNEVDRQILV